MKFRVLMILLAVLGLVFVSVLVGYFIGKRFSTGGEQSFSFLESSAEKEILKFKKTMGKKDGGKKEDSDEKGETESVGPETPKEKKKEKETGEPKETKTPEEAKKQDPKKDRKKDEKTSGKKEDEDEVDETDEDFLAVGMGEPNAAEMQELVVAPSELREKLARYYKTGKLGEEESIDRSTPERLERYQQRGRQALNYRHFNDHLNNFGPVSRAEEEAWKHQEYNDLRIGAQTLDLKQIQQKYKINLTGNMQDYAHLLDRIQKEKWHTRALL